MSGEREQRSRTTQRIIGQRDTISTVERRERMTKQVNDYVFNTTLYFLSSYSDWHRLVGGGEYE